MTKDSLKCFKVSHSQSPVQHCGKEKMVWGYELFFKFFLSDEFFRLKIGKKINCLLKALVDILIEINLNPNNPAFSFTQVFLNLAEKLLLDPLLNELIIRVFSIFD